MLNTCMSNILVCFLIHFLVLSDLLRRLSTTQNTVFCGRIQVFLARLFPLSEKSGKLSISWVISHYHSFHCYLLIKMTVVTWKSGNTLPSIRVCRGNKQFFLIDGSLFLDFPIMTIVLSARSNKNSGHAGCLFSLNSLMLRHLH